MIVRIGTVLATLALAAVGASAAPAAVGAEPLRVGVVLDSVGLSNPIENALVEGVRRAVDRFGVQAEVVTPPPREGQAGALHRFGRQRYDLVLIFNSPDVGVALTIARAYPRTIFAIVDFSRTDFQRPAPNLIGIPFRSEEIGYVVGYLAGLMEGRRPGKDVVAAVGGFSIPPVDRFLGGFGAGARRASPQVEVLISYAGSFTAPPKCRRIALAQIAQGAGAIFDVAGYCGTGTLAAAKAQDRWAIGVDFDRSGLGPFILSSAVKRFDMAAFRVIGTLAAGRLRGGRDYPQSLRTGGLALGRFSPVVPEAIRKQARAVERDVAAGRVRGIPVSTPQ